MEMFCIKSWHLEERSGWALDLYVMVAATGVDEISQGMKKEENQGTVRCTNGDAEETFTRHYKVRGKPEKCGTAESRRE